ncbi:hypothetical protein GOD97_05785 [Paeniclostridium sordellii]|uniref:hypothetical protein n=1 Tax=Paraclostridium sordellii TaxID=1505 RepID=UPI0012EEC60B|nr:hypothetical protein [Paeniclostridium sordellii]MDU6483050.1 hypothetical protein [Paeniclostridium sordellii]MVO74240.1 hypothetical protein [Paeniclostridium sordellii]
MNYELIKNEILELSIKEEQEYYEYIMLNAYKAKALDLILKEISSCRKNIDKILDNYCRANSF